ncbi:MAG: DUF3318 domain-containing protein [Elainella sp.]
MMQATELSQEINRLLELMPASGRMYCKIVSDEQQSAVIARKLPLPNQEMRPVRINFRLWQQLTQPQRDLLLLQSVSWLTSIRWFKPEPYQGLAAAGAVLTGLELLQTNAAAAVTFGGLTLLALSQIWRKNRSNEAEIAADEQAIRVAQRRGYSQAAAAKALASALEQVAQLEGRDLTVAELLRQQQIQAHLSRSGA